MVGPSIRREIQNNYRHFFAILFSIKILTENNFEENIEIIKSFAVAVKRTVFSKKGSFGFNPL